MTTQPGPTVKATPSRTPTRTKLTCLSILCAAALLSAAAGCSGDSGDASTAGTATTATGETGETTDTTEASNGPEPDESEDDAAASSNFTPTGCTDGTGDVLGPYVGNATERSEGQLPSELLGVELSMTGTSLTVAFEHSAPVPADASMTWALSFYPTDDRSPDGAGQFRMVRSGGQTFFVGDGVGGEPGSDVVPLDGATSEQPDDTTVVFTLPTDTVAGFVVPFAWQAVVGNLENQDLCPEFGANGLPEDLPVFES